MISRCFPGFIQNPAKLTEADFDDKQSIHPLLFCYFVILEANDNPYAVQERLDKAVIDQAFDTARVFLLGKKPGADSEMVCESKMKFEFKAGARICFHLGRYFKAIHSLEQAKQLLRKAIKMGENADGQATRLLDEISTQQKTTVISETEAAKMEVDQVVEEKAPLDAQRAFRKCVEAVTKKQWSQLFSVRQSLQQLLDISIPAATNLTDGQKQIMLGDSLFLLIGLTLAENVW